MKTIKNHYIPSVRIKDLNQKSELNAIKALALREELINKVAAYCAELSHVLLVDFAENIAMEMVELPMTEALNSQLKIYDKMIRRQGLYLAGEFIVTDMRRLVA